ncbi:unnamed protein product [Brachionus calyciflorus]|uniref:Uncharacterized protein n=1 Tax=Brachionus calyciflorus TaxID=104777 RepID=A0A813YQA4_9BILA|nr:unnamed protein product [Brachionus calyciflorus]
MSNLTEHFVRIIELNFNVMYLRRDPKPREFHEKFLNLYDNYLYRNPYFDFNLKANYSFRLDREGKFLRNNETKPADGLEIPVRILDKEVVFKNTNKIKRNILNYIEFLQQKYPVLILFHNELANKTEEEIKNLVELKLMKTIKDYLK